MLSGWLHTTGDLSCQVCHASCQRRRTGGPELRYRMMHLTISQVSGPWSLVSGLRSVPGSSFSCKIRKRITRFITSMCLALLISAATLDLEIYKFQNSEIQKFRVSQLPIRMLPWTFHLIKAFVAGIE